jgi:hypothetical protein
MSDVNRGKRADESSRNSGRKSWQRPTLRHLAAKEARGGGNPHNDGQPGNITPGQTQHS